MFLFYLLYSEINYVTKKVLVEDDFEAQITDLGLAYLVGAVIPKIVHLKTVIWANSVTWPPSIHLPWLLQ